VGTTRKSKTFRHVISIPFIWVVLIPIFLLHFFVFIYQAVAFRLYDIGRVQLRSYISFDREKLGYLSFIDKINCAYCSYANGFFAYLSEIGHRTEYYWCGIKHGNQPGNPVFAYQAKFASYGSEEEYCKVQVASGKRPHGHAKLKY
jgi:hypothetical protein